MHGYAVAHGYTHAVAHGCTHAGTCWATLCDKELPKVVSSNTHVITIRYFEQIIF